MKAQIANYKTHEKAIDAIKVLNKKNFPINKVSLVGSAEIIEDHIHIKSLEFIKKTPAVVGMVAGAVLGLLSGMGYFVIPGVSFLYEAGAMVGAIGGFGIGIVIGSIISFFVLISIKEDNVFKAEEHINEGEYKVILNGTKAEVEKAEHILHTEGAHLKFVG